MMSRLTKSRTNFSPDLTYFVNFRQLNDHLFGKELFIRFTASAFRKLLSVYVLSYFPFDFEGRMWDLIVSHPLTKRDLCVHIGTSKGRYESIPIYLNG